MHRRLWRTRACTLLAAVAVALAPSACSSSGVDKAGGTRTEQPVVLTLADHETGPHQVQLWIEEVQRRSGGSLRIQVTNRWRDQEVAYDKGTIADVQAGKVQLAKVAARAYDTVGVTSFQALLAPFLIDNQRLEQRVLESELTGQTLAGTGKLGLVGLTVLPTDLRKPLGLSRPLVAVEDYRGARIGVREGELAKATFTALGATPVGYVPGGPLSGLDGVELGLETIEGNEYDQQAKALTANITFWPKPVTVVMNRKAFESLTPSQQDALRQAGASVLARQVKLMQDLNNREARHTLCQRGLRFLSASTQELATLRRAVQPVYDQLEHNPQTRSFLQQIQAMRRETRAAAAPDAPACSPSDSATGVANQQATPLEGVYKGTVTRVPPGLPVNENLGDYKITFAGGRFEYAQDSPAGPFASSGTYTIDKNKVVISFDAGENQGQMLACQWSLYKGILTLRPSRSSGLDCGFLELTTWRRAG
jgi:TRAP-type C4-dicarboxylate transport system substrate-binding protein